VGRLRAGGMGAKTTGDYRAELPRSGLRWLRIPAEGSSQKKRQQQAGCGQSQNESELPAAPASAFTDSWLVESIAPASSIALLLKTGT